VSHRSIVLFLRGAIAACMFFAVPAFGATYCVSPSGGTTLWQRLRDWQADSANQATVLKLEQGTYPISIAVDYRTGSTGDLDIEGGYTPGFGCSDSHRSKDASTTILDGGISGTFAIAFETNVRLAVLKLQNYQATTGYDGVFIGAIGSPGDVSVDHVISYANSIFSIRGGSSATVKDMLVYGQPALPGWDAISIGTEEGVATATNLTVADNHAGGLRLGDASDTVNPASLYDSIACNNAGGDVYPDPPGPAPQAEVHHSMVCVLDDQVARFNMTAGPPAFAGTGDYHLSTVPTHLSPAINAGSNAVPNGLPATDIEGNPRVQGGAPDLGAYEANTPYYATYVVTSAADNGNDVAPIANSLRWALVHARSDALAVPSRKLQVAFNLPCPSLIVMSGSTPLHDIDFDVTIDATSNPGWSGNTGTAPGFNAVLCAGMNGNGALATGLHVVTGGRLTVAGMRFGGFTDAAIRIDAGSGSRILGNQIGGVGVGPLNLFDANNDGVRISGSASGVFVGNYDDPTSRNQISDNTRAGVYIDSSGTGPSAANYVVNNLIGLDSSGSGAFANGDGVFVFDSGYNVIQYDTLSGNTRTGVTLSGAGTHDARLQYNLFGMAEFGNNDVSNGTYAALVSLAASGNTIGADQSLTGGGNRMFANGAAVYVSPSGGSGNRVLANTILTGTGLGIDLGAAGPTANDALDGDGGANLLQNYPVMLRAVRGDTLSVEGTLDSTPNTGYRLDFYWAPDAGPGGRGEAEYYLGRASTGLTDALGNVHFQAQLPVPIWIPIDLGHVSATATDAAGNTSEIGVAVLELADLIFRDGFE